MTKSNMFLICSKKWDEKSQKWTESDVTDMAKCCTNECLEPVNFCYSYCEKNYKDNLSVLKYRCKQMCEDQRAMCLDTCSLISPYVSKEDNSYIKCAIDNKCVSIGLEPDINCLLKQKDNIFECCTKKSIPSSEVDNIKHCKYLESMYLNPVPTLVHPNKYTRISSLSEFKKSRFGSKNKKTSLSIKLFISISLIYFVIFGLIVFLISKNIINFDSKKND